MYHLLAFSRTTPPGEFVSSNYPSRSHFIFLRCLRIFRISIIEKSFLLNISGIDRRISDVITWSRLTWSAGFHFFKWFIPPPPTPQSHLNVLYNPLSTSFTSFIKIESSTNATKKKSTEGKKGKKEGKDWFRPWATWKPDHQNVNRNIEGKDGGKRNKKKKGRVREKKFEAWSARLSLF